MVALGLLLGCASAERRELTLEDLNVLLIVLDTVGAEHMLLETSGHTPNLHLLAQEGVAFRRAYSTAPWTQPAVASLLTSRMPSRHGLVRLFDVLRADHVTLTELLRERGFATAAVISHDLLRRKYGFAQGFDVYDERNIGGHEEITSHAVTDAAIGWLDQRSPGQPFFLLVHYFDPHYVYHHHPSYDQTSGYEGRLHSGMGIWQLRQRREKLDRIDLDYLVGLYREEIAYTDAHVGRLLDHLRALGVKDDTLVVVAADHGEEFMRHGWIGHTRTLYDELVHVPLIFSLPGRFPPARIDWPASILDVVPSLLALSSRQMDASSWEGISLLPWLRGVADGAPPDRDLFAEVSFAIEEDHPDFVARKSAFKTALLRPDLKLIHDLSAGRWELYDRKKDAEELNDLARSRPHAKLRERLLAWEAARDRDAPQRVNGLHPTEEELERLRALGYVQ